MKKPELEHKMENYITYLVKKFKPVCFNEKPVILHSIRVANSLYELGYEDEIVLGALLHDVVEDSSITIDALRKDFNDDVAELVNSLTENKNIKDKIKRNEDLIDKSVKYGFNSLIIKCADILDNSHYHYLIDSSNKELNNRLFKKYDYFLKKATIIKDEPIYVQLKNEVKKLKEEIGIKMKDIKLIKPTIKEKRLFEEYKKDFNKNGEKEIYGDLGLDKDITYEQWLKRVESFESGKMNVPKTIYALLRESDNKIVGTFTICHYLDEGLYLYGGHIAGSTCPSERGKGYAKLSLSLALEKAKEIGIQYVLCTCDEENKGSSKTIKSCGGQFENIVVDENGHKIERYWINLGKKKLKATNLNNSIVSIIAPATNLKESNIVDVNDSIKKANDLGIKVEVAKNAYSISKDKEEKIKEKIEDIHSCFDNKKIDGMFCAKGGQFCKNLIDKIDYNKISENPKVFGGISDSTFLLNAIYAKTGLITFHMSDFKRFVKNSEYNEQTFKHIFLENKVGTIPQREKWITLKDGIGTGTLVGGNLTCLTMLSETKYFPDDENLILFLEDLEGATTPEGIQKSINILKNKGILARTKGLLIADYINSNDLKFEDILLPLLEDYDFPIIKCHDFGHAGINCVLPIGCEATVDGFGSQLVLNEKPLL